MTDSTRQQVLARIRSATSASGRDREVREAAYDALPRSYQRTGALAPAERMALLVERLREYGAAVTKTSPEQLPQAIAAAIAASGKRILAAPLDLPSTWLAAGPEWRLDADLTVAQIEAAEGVVTASTCAVADSGTIVLHHGPAEGRRVLTLLPDWHLCVLRSSQVVSVLPEYFTRFPQPAPLATWFSGPSATADIEMTRIKGVHGPRALSVILVEDAGEA